MRLLTLLPGREHNCQRSQLKTSNLILSMHDETNAQSSSGEAHSPPPGRSSVDPRSTSMADGLALRREWRWQRAALPLMSSMLLGLTIAFLWISVSQMGEIRAAIDDRPKPDSSLWSALSSGAEDRNVNPDGARLNALVALEEVAMQRRYHQAGMMMLARVWTRYMGFITGMIMALVGAAFILGRLRDTGTRLRSGSADAAWTELQTSTPGVVLAVLGTTLMITASVVKADVTVQDAPIFTRSFIGSGSDSPRDSLPGEIVAGLEKVEGDTTTRADTTKTRS